MTSKRVLISAFVVVSGYLGFVTAQPATTQPAAVQLAMQPSEDPNWIGPKAWERHLTIPPFKPSSEGMGWKIASTRPASEATPTVWLRRRVEGEGSGTSVRSTTSDRPSRSGRAERSSRSSRSERSGRGGRGERY